MQTMLLKMETLKYDGFKIMFRDTLINEGRFDEWF